MLNIYYADLWLKVFRPGQFYLANLNNLINRLMGLLAPYNLKNHYYYYYSIAMSYIMYIAIINTARTHMYIPCIATYMPSI